MKPKSKKSGGRPIDYLSRCIVMEVQLQRRCSQRTAERYLKNCGWQYAEVLGEDSASLLDKWDNYTVFDQGRYYGILESELW